MKIACLTTWRGFIAVINMKIDSCGVIIMDDKIPLRELGQCIAMALTYHLDKR